MFIYGGKLEWMHYGVDEAFFVVLPNGPVRVGDIVYLYTQWTVDAKGVKKGKWFQSQRVEKVVRGDNGDDTFTLAHGYYSWELQSQSNYGKVVVNMSNPGGVKSAMTLARVYQPQGEASTDPARIWTGVFNWPQYATDELFMLVVPEGFGAGKPVIGLSQWTVSQDGKPKVNCYLHGVQQNETPSEGKLKFTFSYHYVLTCTWDEKTEALAVTVQEPHGHTQDVGPCKLAALVQHHTEDVTPPVIPAGKAEFDVRYPQAEPALARIHATLPFPRTLIDTLTHTAAFLDEAGYMAKYAVDRYHALDKLYHALLKQTDDLNAQIRDLTAQIRQLTTLDEAEKKEIEALQKKLTEVLDAAAKKEAELTKQIQDLQKALANEKDMEEEEKRALDAAHDQINREQEARARAERQVAALQFALAESQRHIVQLQAQMAELSGEVGTLRGQLDAERAHSEELEKRAGELGDKVALLEKDAVAMRKTLARTAEDLEESRRESDAKDKVIEALQGELAIVKKDRDAKETAYEELQRATSATIQMLEAEIAALKAQWPSYDFPKFPDGLPSPFPDPFSGPGVIG